jgi:hypothetical protein
MQLYKYPLKLLSIKTFNLQTCLINYCSYNLVRELN